MKIKFLYAFIISIFLFSILSFGDDISSEKKVLTFDNAEFYSIEYNGKILDFNGLNVGIGTYISVEDFFGILDCSITVEREFNDRKINFKNKEIIISANGTYGEINGEYEYISFPTILKKDRLYVSANFIAKAINGEISVDVDNKIIKIKSPEAIVVNVKDSNEEFEKNYPFLNRSLEKSFSENYNFSITSTSLIDIKNCEDTLKSFVDSSNIFLKYDTYGLINAKNGYASINIYNTVNEGILDSENESSIIVHQNSVYKKFSDDQWYMFDKDDNYKMPLFSIDILTKPRTKELFAANIKKIIVKEVGKNKIYYLNLNQKEFNSTIDKMVGGGIMSKILTASLDSDSEISIKDIKMQLMVNEWGQINASHFEAKISVKNDVPSLDMNLYFSEDGRYYDYGIKKDVEIPQIQ